MRNFNKVIYAEIKNQISVDQISDIEPTFLSANRESYLLSDHTIDLVNLFQNEAKKANSADSIIKIFNHYFSSLPFPVLVINKNLLPICSNISSENGAAKNEGISNFKQIFSEEDIAYLKKNINTNSIALGPLASRNSKIDFMVYNYPIKMLENNTDYNLLIIKKFDNISRQASIIADYDHYPKEIRSDFSLNEIYKAFLDTLDGFYFIIDEALNILFISGKIEQKLGYNPEDISGLPLNYIVPSKNNTGLYKDLEKICQWESTYNEMPPIKREIQVKDSRGNTTFFELNITQFNNYKSDKNFLLCSCIDINEKKIREKELEEEKCTAENKDRTKSEFLSNMSHEIRTPLNGIIGFSAMLDRENLGNSKRDKYMQIIRSSSRQLLTLVNDIVDFSKIEAGELKIFNKPTDLNTIIDELFITYSQEIKRLNKENIILKKVEVNKNEKLIINTDEIRLSQVFVNLLNNALKFTKAGEISFGYLFESNNKNKLRLFVKDTGVGIAKEEQDSVFSRFIQTREGEKPKYKGTGLGLAISKGIVELLGSQLKLNSKVNVGSEFYFVISLTE